MTKTAPHASGLYTAPVISPASEDMATTVTAEDWDEARAIKQRRDRTRLDAAEAKDALYEKVRWLRAKGVEREEVVQRLSVTYSFVQWVDNHQDERRRERNRARRRRGGDQAG